MIENLIISIIGSFIGCCLLMYFVWKLYNHSLGKISKEINESWEETGWEPLKGSGIGTGYKQKEEIK